MKALGSDMKSPVIVLSIGFVLLFVSRAWSFLEIRPFLSSNKPDKMKTIHPVWNTTSIFTKTTATTYSRTMSTIKKSTQTISFKNWTTPFPVLDTKYNYDEFLYKSILFYEAQRSGPLPQHRRLTWRHDSALQDRGNLGEDLTGGWYDAGDHMKFGFTMAGATTLLLWSVVEFREAYQKNGLLKDMLDSVRWPLEYFLKAHTLKFEFYAQVGDPYVDHSYWSRPEDLLHHRPAYRLTKNKPGSDVIAETAAALAAGAIVFNSTDRRYSALLLHHAMELFEFADRYRGKYSDSIPGVSEFYPSSGYQDELVWAASWLYRATGFGKYLEFAEKNYLSGWFWSFSWDQKEIGTMALLYTLTRKPKYKTDVISILKDWLPGGNIPYTPKGLVYRSSWGVLRYAGNMALVALIVAKAGIHPTVYHHWARQQIHYILGDGGRSYVVGFGNYPPSRPHHAGSSCHPGRECSWDDFQSPEPNPIVLYGALVGGPDINDQFTDDRADFVHNEVTCDYNAGFHSAVAGLRYFSLQSGSHQGNT